MVAVEVTVKIPKQKTVRPGVISQPVIVTVEETTDNAMVIDKTTLDDLRRGNVPEQASVTAQDLANVADPDLDTTLRLRRRRAGNKEFLLNFQLRLAC